MSRRFPILLAVIAAAVAAVSLGAVPATAAQPCWKRLINDWFDGRIDKSYPVSCYRAAIKNLPEDVASYSRARDDIERALLAAIRAGRESGTPLGPADPVPPQTNRPVDTGGEEDDVTEVTPPSEESDGGILDPLDPANADSIPLPLLILAGLAAVLLAAATAGYAARRIQARRVPVTPPPDEPGQP